MSLEIDQLVAQAWINADAMQVLVDYLLEKGEITQMTEEDARYVSAWHLPPNASWSDDALFRLEVQAREWILNHLLERLGKLELRITGGWPDFFYVVHRLDGPKGVTTLSERAEVFGVTKQPRLLRAINWSCPTCISGQATKDTRIPTSVPAERASNERPREAGLERGGSLHREERGGSPEMADDAGPEEPDGRTT